MKLGMNTVILGAAALEQALQCVSWSGYKYVELAAINGMAEHIKFGDNAGVIRELLQRFELEATAIEAATNDRERLQGIFRSGCGNRRADCQYRQRWQNR